MEAKAEVLLTELKSVFGHGDPEFINITAEEIVMYNQKNRDYAGSGDEVVDPNGNFDRVAAFFTMYPNLSLGDPRVVAMVYAMKQIDQVFWSLSRGFEGEVEDLDARLTDIHIYTKIVRVLNRRQRSIGDALSLIRTAMRAFKAPFIQEKE